MEDNVVTHPNKNQSSMDFDVQQKKVKESEEEDSRWSLLLLLLNVKLVPDLSIFGYKKNPLSFLNPHRQEVSFSHHFVSLQSPLFGSEDFHCSS